jgi:glutamyl-Q tRNA(Asp) synthetase
MSTYRGRFAPSPTGPLHFGSLVAAVGSYLEARNHGGEWLVRMEDLDRPRTLSGAADEILRTLECYGFEWDGPVIYQSARTPLYEAALDRLVSAGQAYDCACSRKEIADSALRFVAGRPGGETEGQEHVYPGTCRSGLPAGRAARAVRLRVDDTAVNFVDALQGRIEQELSRSVGDFVVRRADGLFAYQLAVVVDDADQGVTDVVRGSDLLSSTPRQIFLQRLLGYRVPHFVHLPVAVNAHGEKLSKQTRAPALDRGAPASTLVSVLGFLQQEPPAALARAELHEVWEWARAHWDRRRVARERTLPGIA